MDRVSSPEQLNDYIKVSNPAVWMIISGIVILLVGICVWGIFGKLNTVIKTGGICEKGVLNDDTVFTVTPGEEYNEKLATLNKDLQDNQL